MNRTFQLSNGQRVPDNKYCWATLRAMRLRLALSISLFAFGFIGLFECACADQAQTNAPTGVYVSLTFFPQRLTVELKTNGVYSAFETSTNSQSTNSQTGVWRRDALRRQFSLTPSTNGGTFDQLRILRVDPRETNTLQWIPLGRVGGGGGAIDYVRFKRKDE